MAVRATTSRADSGAKRPSTAITRHSAMVRLKRAAYSRAIDRLTVFASTDRR